MCSSDSKNKRICQTLTTASVSCVMYSGRVPSSSWEFLFTLFCSFSHSSLKTKTFMTTPFTNANASTNLPNVQKVRLVPEQSLERSVYSFLRWRTLWTTNSDWLQFLFPFFALGIRRSKNLSAWF